METASSVMGATYKDVAEDRRKEILRLRGVGGRLLDIDDRYIKRQVLAGQRVVQIKDRRLFSQFQDLD